MDRQFRGSGDGVDRPVDRSGNSHPQPLFGADNVPMVQLHHASSWEERILRPPPPVRPQASTTQAQEAFRYRLGPDDVNEQPPHRTSPEIWGHGLHPPGRPSSNDIASQSRQRSPLSSYVIHGSQSSRGSPTQFYGQPDYPNQATPVQNLDEQTIASGATGRGRGKRKTSRSDDKVDKAIWNENKHQVFIRLCVEQKLAGNKPSNTLNKVGYENLEREFFNITGCRYSRSQFKNHWDVTRRDWQAWKALSKETGMGWDDIKGTYSQTDEWWASFGKRFPGGEKFAHHPLTHEDELDMLFKEGAALGDDMHVPSSGILPDDDSHDIDGGQGADNLNGSSAFQGEEDDINDAGTPAHSISKSASNRNRRQRVSSADRFQNSMKYVADLLLAKGNAPEPTQVDEPYSIEKAMDVLDQTPGVVRDSPEYFNAIDRFEHAHVRRMFLALKTHTSRALWVAREYEKSLGSQSSRLS